MPERLGPRKPADPEQAKRNRADVRARVQRSDPVLAQAVQRAVRETPRRTARSR